MNRFLIFFCAISCFLPVCSRGGDYILYPADPFSQPDPLAPRDEYGLLHQEKAVRQTDLAPRHSSRFDYFFVSGRTLTSDPAYVSALQTALARRGYYCGPFDGVFSPEVSAAIARMQKNSSQHVTGTLTIGVRRGLHLP